jgi:hypothetical protein
MRSSFINENSNENSDEEQEEEDTFHTPVHSPLLNPMPSLPPPPPLTRQDSIGIRPPQLKRQDTIGFQSYPNDDYEIYDEPVPSRLTRQVCVGSSLPHDNQAKVERSMIVNLNGRLVDLRQQFDLENGLLQPHNSPDVPVLKSGGETPPPFDEPSLDETPPMPLYQPKLYRGFNNKQQVMDILPVLRAWLVIQNDPDIDYEDEVWRDTRDSITDQMRRFVDDIDWWVLGAKGGPWEYCVETPECFASTMGINDPNINYGSYKNENKGLFTKRQIELIYNTMMENTRIAMKMETINKLFEF